ncbi:MAG: transporter [Gammaproteobacteria bacterium]
MTTLLSSAGNSLYVTCAHADHGSLGFGIGTAAPVITQTAVPLPSGMWAGGILTNFISIDGASDSKFLELKNNAVDDAHGDVHSISTYLEPSVFAAYGITDNLTLGLRIPYVLRSNVKQPNEEGTEVDKLGDANGFGDVRVFGQYRFFNTADNLNHVSLLFGLKTPTGRTHVKHDPIGSEDAHHDEDEEEEEGGHHHASDIFEPHFQPGSGSWDPSAGLAFTKVMGSYSFDTSALYTVSTKGAQNTELGDSFEYNLALSYAFGAPVRNAFFASSNNAPWTAILELNGEWRDKQRTDGVADPNSGGHTLYISPGIRFSGGKSWNTALSIGAPIVKDFNGYQAPPDYRISYRFVAVF